jgi:NhaA family Na+:H+ antiporter
VLSGIGFTMSLFIAGQAFRSETDFAAVKIAVFMASGLAAVLGTGWLWWTGRPSLAAVPES